jgi:hypothetical protein
MSSLSHTPRPAKYAIGLILVGSVAVKLFFIWHLQGRAYDDVFRAIHFGNLINEKAFSIHTHVINSKTFLGPIVWAYLYDGFGMPGLKLLNLLMFILLFFTQWALGKKRYAPPTIVLALFIFAFYVGTNRNIAAGEPDDNLAALLFTLGVLGYLNAGWVFGPSILMGMGFLFKFWVVIFFAGFAGYLLLQRRFRDFLLASAGVLMPFVFINLVDGGASTRALLMSTAKQQGYSDWQEVAFKMVSTGLIFSVLISAYAWFKQKNCWNTLFFFISSAYFVYVVLARDAFSASFVMMECLVFSSFLIADCLLSGGYLSGGGVSKVLLFAFCVLYLLSTFGVTYLNLYRDTKPETFIAVEDPV